MGFFIERSLWENLLSLPSSITSHRKCKTRCAGSPKSKLDRSSSISAVLFNRMGKRPGYPRPPKSGTRRTAASLAGPFLSNGRKNGNSRSWMLFSPRPNGGENVATEVLNPPDTVTAGEIARAAIAYTKAGLSVVPILTNGSKAPDGHWKDYQGRIATKDELRGWFGAKDSAHGIGIVGGAVSGNLEHLDIDRMDAVLPFVEAIEDHGYAHLLLKFVIIDTPRGRRYMYRVAGKVKGNTPLAYHWENGVRTVAIETRGEGGQAVMPPSPRACHPLHKPYMLVQGDICNPPTITADEYAMLHAMAMLVSERDPHETPVSLARNFPTGTGRRPGDDFDEKTGPDDLAAMMERAGWSIVCHMRSGKITLRRPGKAAPGISGTINYNGQGDFFCFSSNANPFGPMRGYTPFSCLAILEHGGSFVQAASDLARRGYGEKRQTNVTVKLSSPSVLIGHAAAEPVPHTADWPEIMQLTDDPLPEFPVHSLPSILEDYVQQIAQSVQCPIDMTAMAALGSLSAIASRIARIRLGGEHSLHIENLNLYTLVIADPGTRKSSAMSPFVTPIQDIETRLIAQDKARLEADKFLYEATCKRIEAMKNEYARAKNDSDRRVIEDEIRTITANHNPPRGEPKLLVDDITNESLARNIADQPDGCLALISDEGGVFSLIRGQYAKSGTSANMNIYLKAWDGKQYKNDRVGSASYVIPSPMLTINMMVQPAVLQGIGKDGALEGNGFLHRFLYSVPRNMAGNRPNNPNPAPILFPETFNMILNGLWGMERAFAMKEDKRMRWLLTLDPDAMELYGACANDVDARMRSEGDLKPIDGWASKLHGNVARIAGILHLAKMYDKKRPDFTLVSGDTIADAWSIGQYCIPHAQAIFGHMQTDPTNVLALKILVWLFKGRISGFRFRDLYRIYRHDGKEKLEAVLLKLAEHGYLRLEADPNQAKTGRAPGPFYAVNPDFWDEKR